MLAVADLQRHVVQDPWAGTVGEAEAIDQR
jgi:hypothetical protein